VSRSIIWECNKCGEKLHFRKISNYFRLGMYLAGLKSLTSNSKTSTQLIGRHVPEAVVPTRFHRCPLVGLNGRLAFAKQKAPMRRTPVIGSNSNKWWVIIISIPQTPP
jgi:hypothetical protein